MRLKTPEKAKFALISAFDRDREAKREAAQTSGADMRPSFTEHKINLSVNYFFRHHTVFTVVTPKLVLFKVFKFIGLLTGQDA